MKKKSVFFIFAILTLAFFQLGMGRNPAQYDEEAREAERLEKEHRKAEKAEHRSVAKNFASGVKQATVDNTTDLISETAEGTRDDAPMVGTLEGARQSTGKILDNTVKGAVKVATLGYGHVEHYEVEEPAKGSNEPTKIKFKIPGS